MNNSKIELQIEAITTLISLLKIDNDETRIIKNLNPVGKKLLC